MKEVTGQLSMLGNAKLGRDLSTYSVIKIGRGIVERLQCPYAMDSFLQMALNRDTDCTLFIQGRRLVGIKLSDDDFYCYKMNTIIPLAIIALGVVFLCLFFLILPIFLAVGLLWVGIRELTYASAGMRLKGQGAVPLSVVSRN